MANREKGGRVVFVGNIPYGMTFDWIANASWESRLIHGSQVLAKNKYATSLVDVEQ
jgi:hypothetical protein